MLVEAIEHEAATRPLPFSYRNTLVAAQRVNWRIEDIIGGERKLDFSRPFMPESLARTGELGFLTAGEQRSLNQIKGHTYLSIFGLVEEFILPFVIDHVRPSLDRDDYRVRAYLQFASEEAKHIQLFKVFADEFRRGFPAECAVIGPPSAIAEKVLSHQPLAVALLILHIEWMTQRHFVDSIRTDEGLDPLFKSLLKHHWLEEAQHAKLDTLMVRSLADGMSEAEIERAVDEYLEIGAFIDGGLGQQVEFELEALEAASGISLTDEQRKEFIDSQHQANRWTYLGSGMTHPRFLEMLGELSDEQRDRVAAVSEAFC